LHARFGTIENILENLPAKYTVPTNWPDINKVREVFKNPKIVNPKYLDVCY
jgi:hypothetical protein